MYKQWKLRKYVLAMGQLRYELEKALKLAAMRNNHFRASDTEFKTHG